MRAYNYENKAEILKAIFSNLGLKIDKKKYLLRYRRYLMSKLTVHKLVFNLTHYDNMMFINIDSFDFNFLNLLIYLI